MKLKIAKIVFVTVCIAAFVFLLLPFLETTPPKDPSQLKAQPQVTTSNPLTAIANRLKALFGGKERSARRMAANPSSNPLPAEELLLAGAARASVPGNLKGTAIPSQPQQISVPETEDTQRFGDASLQTDNGEWVLIRQTAPQSGQPGMHEVNVHENPYDRYIKQERARRFHTQQPRQDIPDSKWARLVRPVKQFFGLDTPQPLSARPISLQREDEHARSLASAKGKKTYARTPAAGPTRIPLNITPQQWALMTPQERQQARERQSVAQFTDLLSGTRDAQESAEIAADAKYPNPKNEQERQAKEEYTQQLTEQNKEIIKNGILTVMQENAADKEPVDELAYMMGCKSTSLPTRADSCSADDLPEPPTPHAPADVISQEQAKNTQAFFEKTGYVLPKDLPLTIVLGPTTPETISQMVEYASPAAQPTAEIYQFLYEQQACASNTCYWVANSKQKDPQLTDAVAMTSAQLKPDPSNTYPGYKQAFVEYKLAQLPPDATSEQQKRAQQQAVRQFEDNAVHYVPYTTQQLKQVQDKTMAAADPNNNNGQASDLTIFYVTDPAQASQFAQAIDSVIFGYGQISLANTDSAPDAAEQIMDSTAQNVNDAKQVISTQVTQPALSESLQNQLNQQIRQQNQSGAGWEGIFNATKHLGSQK